jgi:LysM repeat protein
LNPSAEFEKHPIMKTTLWLTTFSMLAASPLGFSKTELEVLRSTVAEQERQIRHLEEENMKLRSLNGEKVAPPVARNEKPAAGVAAAGGSYTVKSGDTLAKISRKTGASVNTLTRLNGIKDPSRLKVGQKLKLPEAAVAGDKPASAPHPAPAVGETYIVRNGDTFFSIAKKHSVSTESLVAANPRIKPSELRPGQLINLHRKSAPAETAAEPPKKSEQAGFVKNSPSPVLEESPAPVAASEPAASPSPAPQPEPAPASAEPAKTAVHSVTIDGEMTYGEFAAKHGTQVERLNELNGLDLTQNTVLAKGSELYVNAQP